MPQHASVLDVGSGDSRLARLIADKRPDISNDGLDVCLRREAAFPVKAFDGKSIPFDESSFDVVMLVDVLHQTDDPIGLLREAVRVARQAIVINDHLLKGGACLLDAATHGAFVFCSHGSVSCHLRSRRNDLLPMSNRLGFAKKRRGNS